MLTGLWNSKDIQNSHQSRSKNKLVRKTPWHRPSIGVAIFGLWAPDHPPPPAAATQANNPSVSCLTFDLLFPGPVQACLSHGASFSYSGSFACCHQCDTRRITRLSSHLRTGRIYQISSLATNKMWSDPKNQPVSSPAEAILISPKDNEQMGLPQDVVALVIKG